MFALKQHQRDALLDCFLGSASSLSAECAEFRILVGNNLWPIAKLHCSDPTEERHRERERDRSCRIRTRHDSQRTVDKDSSSNIRRNISFPVRQRPVAYRMLLLRPLPLLSLIRTPSFCPDFEVPPPNSYQTSILDGFDKTMSFLGSSSSKGKREKNLQ